MAVQEMGFRKRLHYRCVVEAALRQVLPPKQLRGQYFLQQPIVLASQARLINHTK